MIGKLVDLSGSRSRPEATGRALLLVLKNQITSINASRIKCCIRAEGANGPIMAAGDILEKRMASTNGCKTLMVASFYDVRKYAETHSVDNLKSAYMLAINRVAHFTRDVEFMND
ncbi:MAG: hypothetical protein M3X11_25235 [Acidobacteriota bacterium]|nr:hypothetical protein [Acidobacteriota bacterium]